ncbi:hypothetical protein U9M48_014066 [Paspalum notatum var. saurae]|uniref:Uncharacterized protein n=1 Tax=Paspalum notatum var. saurae TaxID=547442 RepID=A0AAQ3T0H9_PASNO
MKARGIQDAEIFFDQKCTRNKNDYRIVARKKNNHDESTSDYEPCTDENNQSDESDADLEEEEEMPLMNISSRSKVEPLILLTLANVMGVHLHASKGSHMAPGSRQSKASTHSLGPGVSSRFTRSRLGPSASTSILEERSLEARVDEQHVPLSAPESRGVSTPMLLRSARPVSDAVERSSSINPMDQASDIAGQFEEEMTVLDEVAPERSKRVRDPTWGRGLNKLTKAMGCKMRLSFVEGKKRPEHPVQAAKLALESGIVVRDHMPIYPHWKDYKNESQKRQKDILKDHRGYLAIRFNMDVDDETTQKVCSGLLRDGLSFLFLLACEFPECTMCSQLASQCRSNKRNRGQVQLPQTTGSQSYVAKRYCVRELGHGEEPDSMDLFKASHYSKKKGYSDTVQEVIDAMDIAKDQIPEGEEPKSIDGIVGGVLSEYSRSSKFLQNMGFHPVGSQPASTSNSSARIRELEETIQMQAVQIENGHKSEQELRATITSQQEEMLDLKQKVEEANASNKRNEDEMAILKQKQETTDSLLLRLLSKSPIS